jgi:hypothetical protein
MLTKLLKPRPGFTLTEALVAMTLTAIIGAALTGVFVTQSRLFQDQEHRSQARSVSRSAMNIILSELRMLEIDSGLVRPLGWRKITIRAPYTVGLFCGLDGGQPVLSLIPADTMMLRDAGHTGYAYRTATDGKYTYVASLRDAGSVGICNDAGVRVFTDSGGRVLRMPTPPPITAPLLEVGAPVMLYQRITYEFKASADLPGTVGLWRTIEGRNLSEELAAPFDTTARFEFYMNDAATPSSPTSAGTVTGIKLVLDGLVDPNASPGRHRVSTMSTSVFFRNR